ncbi:hypothetical protein Tco_0378413 [Tanacetum coccineum]
MSEIRELHAANRKRQVVISEMLKADQRRSTEMRELRIADHTRQQQLIQTLTVMQSLQGQVTTLQGQSAPLLKDRLRTKGSLKTLPETIITNNNRTRGRTLAGFILQGLVKRSHTRDLNPYALNETITTTVRVLQNATNATNLAILLVTVGVREMPTMLTIRGALGQARNLLASSVDDKYGYMKSHMKTVKNGQTRTQERKSEQKPEAKARKSQIFSQLQSILVNRSQPQRTKSKIFHFSPPSFRKVHKWSLTLNGPHPDPKAQSLSPIALS